MMNYLYAGLRLASEIPLPELTPCRFEGITVDVTIRYAEIVDAVPEPRQLGVAYRAAVDEFLLEVPGVASYRVVQGCSIEIQPVCSADPDAVRLILLGPVMAAMAQQRGDLVFHAAALASEGGARLLAGASGVGKSTFAAALVSQGLCLMTDELAICRRDAVGNWQLHPSLPRLLLWPDAQQELADTDWPVRVAREGITKQHVELSAPHYTASPLPIHELCLLKRLRHDAPLVARCRERGMAAMLTLREALYRPDFLVGFGLEQQVFAQLGKLANTLTVSRLDVPPSLDAVRQSAARLWADWRGGG